MRQVRRVNTARFAVRAAAFVGVGAFTLAACDSGSPSEGPASHLPVAEVHAPVVRNSDGSVPQVMVSPAPKHPLKAVIAATKKSRVDIYDAPDGAVTQTIDARKVLTAPDRTPLTFLVDEEQDEWVSVHLPVRPNGTTGWVKAADVSLMPTDMRVEIALDKFELKVFRGADEVLVAPIGVGQGERPTPGGIYYIRELLKPPNPGGPYGPYAYGLSGYSPVLDSFKGGDAVIGLHGTNAPETIGKLASNGCIRLSNDVITELVNDVGLPLGAPVYISDADAPADD